MYNKDKLRVNKHKGGKQNGNLSWNYRTRTCTDDVSWNRLRSTGKVKQNLIKGGIKMYTVWAYDYLVKHDIKIFKGTLAECLPFLDDFDDCYIVKPDGTVL